MLEKSNKKISDKEEYSSLTHKNNIKENNNNFK